MAVSFDALIETERIARFHIDAFRQFVDRVVEVRRQIIKEGWSAGEFIALTRGQAHRSFDNLPQPDSDALAFVREAVFRELPPMEYGERGLTAHEMPYVVVVDVSDRYDSILSWDDPDAEFPEDERLKECHRLAMRLEGLRLLIAAVDDRIGAEHKIAWDRLVSEKDAPTGVKARRKRLRELQRKNGIDNEWAKLAAIAKDDPEIQRLGFADSIDREMVRNDLKPRTPAKRRGKRSR